MDEFAAEVQSLKSDVELFDAAKELFSNQIEHILPISADEAIENDFAILIYDSTVLAEYYYFLFEYLTFCKEKNENFYRQTLSDRQLNLFFHSLALELQSLRPRINRIEKECKQSEKQENLVYPLLKQHTGSEIVEFLRIPFYFFDEENHDKRPETFSE